MFFTRILRHKALSLVEGHRERYELGTSFSVLLFLGQFPENPTWVPTLFLSVWDWDLDSLEPDVILMLSSGVCKKKNSSFFIYLANPMLIILLSMYHSDRAVARLESWSCCDRDSVEVPVGAMFPVPGRRTRIPSTKSRTVRWVRSEASWNKISFVTLALWCTQDRRDYQSLDRVSLLHIYFFGYCSLNAHGENMSMEERTTG